MMPPPYRAVVHPCNKSIYQQRQRRDASTAGATVHHAVREHSALLQFLDHIRFGSKISKLTLPVSVVRVLHDGDLSLRLWRLSPDIIYSIYE